MTPTERLVRWLLLRSDVEAALRVMEDSDEFPDKVGYEEDGACVEPNRHWLWDYVDRMWPQVRAPALHAEVYREAGEIEARQAGVFWTIPQTARFRAMLGFLRSLGDRPIRLLDYGCSRAYYPIHAAIELPQLSITGVDIDRVSIEQADRCARRFLPGREFLFTVGTCDTLGADAPDNTPYDVLSLMEVLEHVPDASALLRWAWEALRVGGWLFVTVPLGPVELPMWLREPWRRREHIRELREDCLRGMLVGMADVQLNTLAHAACPITGMETGCTIVVARKIEGPMPAFRRPLEGIATIRPNQTIPLPLPA